MPVSERTHRTAAAGAVDLAAAVLVRVGVPADAARVQAEHLVEAELRGHPSHGLRRLVMLVRRIEAGLIDPRAQPSLLWRTDAALTVDGAGGLGPVTAYRAIDALVGRLPTTGIAIATLHDTHHLGMLAPYVEHLAHRGAIGLVFSSTEGLVHPWGGSGALVGTNPVAIGVPAPEGDVVLDMSTGAVSAGKILDYAAQGRELPSGWAVDAHGHPTTDATAASRGAISPFGGPKGYALGITFGALVGALTGTSFGPDVHGTLDAEHAVTKGDVVIAISPAVLGQATPSPDLGAYLDLVRASGVDGHPVSVPGDRARASRARASTSGFEVSDDVWEAIVELAGRNGGST